MNDLNVKPWQKIAIVCVCIVTFFINNTTIVPDIMESRNIITARAMVDEGCWLIPTMNGQLRLEKPPLPTWITALAEMASPDNLALQRGVAGCAALLMVFFFWKIARRILRINPFCSTLLLCTCYCIVLMGRTASWDIYCHAFMMGGIYYLIRAFEADRCRWRHFIAAAIFTGLSIMSKGPVSPYALFLPFLIAYIWKYKPSMSGKWGGMIAFIVLSLAIGSWWFVYIHFSESEALQAAVVQESGAWMNHNVRAWYYYWKFFLETGVWSLLLLTAMFLPLFNRSRRLNREWQFAMIWMLSSLFLLSLMPEKKSRYLMPLVLPACYVMGMLVEWWRTSLRNAAEAPKSDRLLMRVNTWLIAIVVAALPIAGWIALVSHGYITLWQWALIACVALIVAVVVVSAALRLCVSRFVKGVTVLFLATEALFMPLLGNVINNPEMHSIANTRNMPELDNVPFHYLDTVPLRIELVYAAHRNILPVKAEELRQHLPCALLTHQSITEALPDSLLSGIEVAEIGIFDDNRRPRGNQHFSDDFVYHVTLLRHSVVGYVTSWGDRMPDPSLVTHFNYAFGHVSDSFDGVRIDNPDRLRAIVALKDLNPNLKVLVSIGGWGSGRFSEMAADEHYRTSFAADCMRAVEEYALDGIDIDWEYPTSHSADISASLDDTRNFTLLMRDIREAIGPDHLLTFADYADTTYVDYREVMPYVDFVNLMTYDMANPPHHHSALFRSDITGGLSVSEAVEHHLLAGVPLSQLVVGMPFYGRASQDYKGQRPFGKMQFEGLYHERWDSVAQVPFLVDDEGKMVLAHENERSIALKCQYILAKGLRGAMYWDSDNDDDAFTLSRTVWTNLNE